MSQRAPKRRWSRMWTAFRVLRYVVWLSIFAFLIALIYLNQVGLPGFVKTRLLAQLHRRGVDLQFKRLRLRFDRGLVAEQVRLSRPTGHVGPNVTIKLVQVEVDWRRLWAGRFHVTGLRLQDGKVDWPLAETNREPRQLTLEHLQTELRFRTNDVWELANLQAEFAGAQLHLNGTLTNASAWHKWRSAKKPTLTAEAAERLRQRLISVANAIEKIQFATPAPELRVSVQGDLRDWQRWHATAVLIASGAHTAWGSITNALLNVRLLPADTNGSCSVELALEANAVTTPWAQAKSLTTHLRATNFDSPTLPVALQWTLRAKHVNTRWVQADTVELTSHWRHDLTNTFPRSGDWNLRAAGIETRWGRLTDARLNGQLHVPATPLPSIADTSWGPWRFLEPYQLSMEIEAGRLNSPKLTLDHTELTAAWKAPHLELTHFAAQLYRGRIRGTGAVNVATRQAHAEVASDFDVQQTKPLLTAKGAKWISQYGWKEPPHVTGRIAATLPVWTNRHPDWRHTVLPTLRLSGRFQIGHGSFRGIPVDSATSDVTFSNLVWRLPDLMVRRPEGSARIKHIADDSTHDYYFQFRSTINPQVLRPLVQPKDQRGFDLIHFGTMPLVEGEVWGRWHHPELVGLAGTVTASNLTFRSETGLVLRATVQYTNKVVTATPAEVWRGNRSAKADGLQVNFPADCLYLTNASGTLDPMVIGRAIGPKTAEAFEPYRFLAPPEATANGTIPLHTTNHVANLTVRLHGGPFEWWKIKVPQIGGLVSWQGDTLSLSNVAARFYGGTATGDAQFGLESGDGTRLHFLLCATNADLHEFLADLGTTRKNVQGSVTGRLVITDGVSTNWQTWNGYGEVSMTNGLLWDIPLFGIFSPVLNTMAPGAKLGDSRATEAKATYTITNGVVHTGDMEVRTTLMRLFLKGSVTLDGKLNGSAEASLLHDAGVLGRAVSLVFFPLTKVLEYKVTGTLERPKKEPLFPPVKMLLMPLHPWQTLKDIFGPNEGLPESESSKDKTPLPSGNH